MNSTLVDILVLIVIALVGWFAYSQGYFAAQDEDQSGLEINVGGTQ